MNDSYERSARRALRAYPPRYRAVRGEELLDLVRDLAAPGATRLAWRIWLNLIVGGLTVRLRDRPSFLQRFCYRWFDRRLPERWHDWVRDDINSWSYLVRRLRLVPLITVGPVLVPVLRAQHPSALLEGYAAALLVTALVASLLNRRKIRRAALKRHVVPGFPLVPHGPRVEWVWQMPARQRIWPIWVAVGVGWSLLAPVIAWAIATVPKSRSVFGSEFTITNDTQSNLFALPALAIATAAGVLLLGVSATRSRRRLEQRSVGSAPVTASPRRFFYVKSIGLSLAAGLLVLAGAVADFEPPAAGIGAIVVGAAFGPSVVLLGLLARRIERSSGVVVTSDELVRATLRREPLAARQLSRRMTVAPASPPPGAVAR